MKLFRMLLLATFIGLVFSCNKLQETKAQPTAQPAPRIPYTVARAWSINNGGYGYCIVIDPKYVNEKDMRILGGNLKADNAKDKNSFVFIFDDAKAAAMQQNAFNLNTKDGAFYDLHFIGDYTKNGNTYYHSLQINLEGINGPSIEVPY